MREAIAKKMTIVFIDEVMFTTRAIMTREYSNRGSNIEVNPQDFNIKTTAVIAAISEEHGILSSECYDRSVNTDKFILWL